MRIVLRRNLVLFAVLITISLLLSGCGAKVLTTEASQTSPAEISISTMASVVPSELQTSKIAEIMPPGGLEIGQSWQGGIIAYIYQEGDIGYVVGETHGIISAVADISVEYIDEWNDPRYEPTEFRWSTGQIDIANDTDYAFQTVGNMNIFALGEGYNNTERILAKWTMTQYPNSAAAVTREYSEGGYTDWFLPSQDELNKLYLSKNEIGNFATTDYYKSIYWSSSESSGLPEKAYYQNFQDGYQYLSDKDSSFRVRPIRYF